jgi:hypothetical protein
VPLVPSSPTALPCPTPASLLPPLPPWLLLFAEPAEPPDAPPAPAPPCEAGRAIATRRARAPGPGRAAAAAAALAGTGAASAAGRRPGRADIALPPRPAGRARSARPVIALDEDRPEVVLQEGRVGRPMPTNLYRQDIAGIDIRRVRDLAVAAALASAAAGRTSAGCAVAAGSDGLDRGADRRPSPPGRSTLVPDLSGRFAARRIRPRRLAGADCRRRPGLRTRLSPARRSDSSS